MKNKSEIKAELDALNIVYTEVEGCVVCNATLEMREYDRELQHRFSLENADARMSEMMTGYKPKYGKNPVHSKELRKIMWVFDGEEYKFSTEVR